MSCEVQLEKTYGKEQFGEEPLYKVILKTHQFIFFTKTKEFRFLTASQVRNMTIPFGIRIYRTDVPINVFPQHIDYESIK